jgi:hypothetical protein
MPHKAGTLDMPAVSSLVCMQALAQRGMWTVVGIVSNWGPCNMQAAYHGVPIIGLPMIADQIDNVMKAVHHGFGLAISPKGGIKAQAVEGALQRVIAESSFREAAAKVSKRLRSRVRTPAEEGAGKGPGGTC